MGDKIREAVEYFENLRHCTRCSGAESAELEYFDLAIAALEGQGMPADKKEAGLQGRTGNHQ